MSTIREQLIELFYDNNVHCDQTIEHLVDDVTDIIKDSNIVLPDTIKSIDASAFDGCSREEATCKDCFHYCICKDTVADENWTKAAPRELREMYSPSGCKNYVPAADVVEVRRGKWLVDKGTFNLCGVEHYKCSVCGGHAQVKYPNCPWCIAKMDGKEVIT